ncbi:DUF6082 family protein [Actinoplanes palleronii]|uniref:DUF4760 domain-containing protein n=1 Tax=Actinoplanes palleronii TaxID=113570 RepID=A0ABQ4BC72_9ACTN|nr:DUF6082 family protein [Actinoplanes palleronii]GIE68287.1 hypothetical protein Apa02nite_043950 [Actinoplanes palleronii]
MESTTKAITGWLVAAFVAAGLLLVVAFLLSAPHGNNWEKLADIGQLLGAVVSAAAFLFLAVSVFYQIREQRFANMFNLLNATREINKLVDDKPALYGGIIVPRDFAENSTHREDDIRVFLAVDMIYRLLATGYETKTIKASDLYGSPQVQSFLQSPQTRDYLAYMEKEWRGQNFPRPGRKFAEIMMQIGRPRPQTATESAGLRMETAVGDDIIGGEQHPHSPMVAASTGPAGKPEVKPAAA